MFGVFTAVLMGAVIYFAGVEVLRSLRDWYASYRLSREVAARGYEAVQFQKKVKKDFDSVINSWRQS